MAIRAISLLNNYASTNMTAPFLTPEMPRSMHDALVVIMIENITGGPSAATISPSFQVWNSICGGNQEEVINGGSGVDPTISWFNIAAASNPSMLPDGDWPSLFDVSGATGTTPVAVFKRIDGGFPWRLSLNWALTGGTSPSMKITAIAYVREHVASGSDRTDSGT